MSTPNADSIAQLSPLVAQLASVQEAIGTLQEQEKLLKEQVRNLLPRTGNYQFGYLTVTVQPNRRFDPELAAKLIPEAALPAVTTSTSFVDGSKVKVLFPEVFQAAQKTYEHKIGLK